MIRRLLCGDALSPNRNVHACIHPEGQWGKGQEVRCREEAKTGAGLRVSGTTRVSHCDYFFNSTQMASKTLSPRFSGACSYGSSTHRTCPTRPRMSCLAPLGR